MADNEATKGIPNRSYPIPIPAFKIDQPYATSNPIDSTEAPINLSSSLGTTQKRVYPLSTRKNAPSALFLEHHTMMPEYPTTHKEGFLHIISLQNYPSEIDCSRLHMDIQYSKSTSQNRSGRSHYLSHIFNADVDVDVYEFQCSGVKVCSYAAPIIRNFQHTQMNEQEWSRLLKIIEDERKVFRSDIILAEETEVYWKHVRELLQNHICFHRCGGKLRLKQYATKTDTTPTPIMQQRLLCTQYTDATHFARNIPSRTNINEQYLQRLIENIENDNIEERFCATVHPRSTVTRQCVNAHVQGTGRLETCYCPVKFLWILPKNLRRYPFGLLFSNNIHMHPPAFSHRIPQGINQTLQTILRQTETKSLTLGRLRRSELVQQWIQNQGVTALSDIHQSLSNEDRIRALISREKALRFPFGQGIEAVKFHFTASDQSSSDMYIRAIHETEELISICCFSTEQAKLWKTVQCAQTDVSFKRVLDWYEQTWACRVEVRGTVTMVVTLARIFFNQDSSDSYWIGAKQLFESLEKINGQPVYFHHIHQQGLGAITVDMDTKQAKGLGSYFMELDPDRSWQEHVQSIFIYCLVHFYRGIDAKFANHPLRNEMRRLPELDTQEALNEWFTTFIDDPTTQAWAMHKKTPWILSGIVRHQSRMDAKFWNMADKNSNIIECTHQKSYQSGQNSSLMTAIQNAQGHDREDIMRWRDALAGSSLGYRDLSPNGRLQRQESRQNITTPKTSSWLVPDVSSSGIPRSQSPASTKRTRSGPQSLMMNHKRSKDEEGSTDWSQTIVWKEKMNRIEEKALELKEKELKLQEKQIELNERQARLDQQKTE